MPLKPACIMCCSDCDASAVLTDCQHFLCARCFAKYGPSGKCPRCDRPCRTVLCGSSKFPKDIMERIRADPYKMLKQTIATLEFQKKHEDLSVVRLKELVTILNNSNRNLSGQVQSLQAELSKARDAHNALSAEAQALRHAAAAASSSSSNHQQQHHQQNSYGHQYQQPPPSSSAAAGYSNNNPPPPHQQQQHYPPPSGGGDQTPTSWGRTGGGGGGGGKRDRVEEAEAIRPHRPNINNGNNYQQQTRTPPRSTPTGQAPPPPHQQVLECMTPLLQLTNTVREAKRAQQQTLPQYQQHQQQLGGGGGALSLSRRSVSSHGESEGARAAPAMTGMDAFRLATPAITLRNGIAPHYLNNSNNNNGSSQDLGGYAAAATSLHPPNTHHNPNRGPNDSPQPYRGGSGGGGSGGKPQLHSHLLKQQQQQQHSHNNNSSSAYGRGGGSGSGSGSGSAPSGLTVTALAEHNLQIGGGGGGAAVSPPGAAYVAGAPLPRLLPR